MNNTWSLPLGRPFGIKLFIHWTFIFILMYVMGITYWFGGSAFDIFFSMIFLFALFACVVMHELGHALAARNYGIGTKDITLLPIGGMARLEKMPEDPLEELVVAAAGPLVNVVIAILLMPVVYGFDLYKIDMEPPLFVGPDNFWFVLMFVNIFLVIFNMLPAFPMDGGRILRALLGFRLGHVRATHVATTVGQMFAVLFFIGGFLINPLLIVIAIFVFFAGQAERNYVQTKHTLSGYKVKDVMMREFTPLHKDDPVYKAVGILLNGSEQDFVVLDEQENIAGILNRNDIIQGLSELGRQAPLEKIMHKNITTFPPEKPIEEAYHHMSQTGLSIVPVVDEDARVTGVVDRDNIFEFIWVQDALDARRKVKERLTESS